MLLHYVGEDVCDIFDTLTVPAPEPDTNGDVYKSAVKAISDHFEPQKCVDHHVYNFRKEAQRPNEKTSEFYTRLQLLARKCEFTDVNLEIKRQPIINEQDYLKMKPRPVLLSCTTRVYPYMSSKPLELCGKFQSDVTNKQDTYSGTFYVAKGPSRSLLSWKTSQRLKLIQVTNAVEETEIPEILKEFSELTSGIGEYKGAPVKIHIDESVKPVAQPHRRIPFHVRKQVEEKLDQLMEDDIIERAEGPTSWISPIVVVPKPNNSNEIRICVDMRALNRAIIRERHVIPTTDDIIAGLNGCKVFSKIDLNQGYHQFPLHEDSRNLTTFSTHVGLYRYKERRGSVVVSTSAWHAAGRWFDSRTRHLSLLGVKTWLSTGIVYL